MQQTNDDKFCLQVFLVLKLDARVPAYITVCMKKRATWKYSGGSGLTEVVKPGGRQYTENDGKVLVEAIQLVI